MRFIRYFIGGILVLYFQILIAPRLSVLGIAPFFLLPYIVFISINLRLSEATTIAFFTGLALDILNPFLLGVNTALLLMVSYLVTRYHTSVTKDKISPVAISVLLLNLMYYIPLFLLKGVIFDFEMLLLTLLPVEIVYNSLITILFLLLLTVIQKMRVTLDA